MRNEPPKWRAVSRSEHKPRSEKSWSWHCAEGTRGDVPGKRDVVMKAKDMLTDRHWHCQTPTCEKLSSLSPLLVCNLTSLGAQLALRRCLEKLGTSRYRGSTKMRCTWNLRSRYLAGGQKPSGTLCRTVLWGSHSQLTDSLDIHLGKSATALILSFLKSRTLHQKQIIISSMPSSEFFTVPRKQFSPWPTPSLTVLQEHLCEKYLTAADWVFPFWFQWRN